MELDLFEELIQTLNDNVTILSKKDSNKILKLFKSKTPIPFFRVDWGKIPNHIIAKSEHYLFPSLNKLLNSSLSNDQVYVLWNDASLPVIKTDLESIVKHFDDVISVGFETWLFNPEHKYVIECISTGHITMGLLE